MAIYSVEFIIHATAYIRADNEEQAKAEALKHKGHGIDLEYEGVDEIFCGLQYSNPDLPDFSFSPAFTIGDPDLDHVENVSD
jgi:hypothetical protein